MKLTRQTIINYSTDILGYDKSELTNWTNDELATMLQQSGTIHDAQEYAAL